MAEYSVYITWSLFLFQRRYQYWVCGCLWFRVSIVLSLTTWQASYEMRCKPVPTHLTATDVALNIHGRVRLFGLAMNIVCAWWIVMVGLCIGELLLDKFLLDRLARNNILNNWGDKVVVYRIGYWVCGQWCGHSVDTMSWSSVWGLWCFCFVLCSTYVYAMRKLLGI